MPSPAERLPATLVTGFLGSGKTTLLNHVLTQRQGVRTAVIVNDFAELGLDAELIVAAEDDLLELTNGCLCCSLAGDLERAVERVLERSWDHLLIETTGLSDPLAVALTLLQPRFRARLRLDGVVQVVDLAEFAPERVSAHADVILLNKCDLVADVDAREAEVRALAPQARLVRTVRSQVDLALILDCFTEKEGMPAGVPHGYSTLVFESDRPLAVHRFQALLEDLPEGVFRGKGRLHVAEVEQRYLFQLVGRRFTLDPWAGGGGNRLVFLGPGLDAASLRARLEECLSPA